MLNRKDLEEFLEVLSDATLLVTDNTEIIFANSACASMFGYSKEQILGLHIESLMSEKLRSSHPKMVRSFINSSGKSRQMMARSSMPCLKQSGEAFKAQISIASIQLGKEKYGIATIQDFTVVHHEIESLHEESNTDSLTMLYNRRFLDSILKSNSRFMKKATHVGVLYLDLNQFKPLNDTHGHDCGDLVLREVSLRLKNILRHDDYAVRIGGDEFILILDLSHSESKKADLESIANKIHSKISEPIRYKNITVSVGASIGAGLLHEDSSELSDLIRLADEAMYISKQSGRILTFVSDAI